METFSVVPGFKKLFCKMNSVVCALMLGEQSSAPKITAQQYLELKWK